MSLKECINFLLNLSDIIQNGLTSFLNFLNNSYYIGGEYFTVLELVLGVGLPVCLGIMIVNFIL